MSLIIDWLFPKSCFACHKGDKYLCNLCEGKMMTGSLTQNRFFEGIISIYKYDGVIKKVVEKIKYDYVSDAVEEMGELMGKKLKLNYPNIVDYWQKEKFTLVPIPLYWQRKNWRGFNQSELLANSLAGVLNLKCERGLLIRKVKTKNQASIKNRQVRRKNITSVFEVNKEISCQKNLILVDDVITSGATMTAALKTLKKIGVSRAWGLCLCGVQK